jgi:hypothetical protein
LTSTTASRSRARNKKPSTTKNARKMSSIAIRLWTNSRKSVATSRAEVSEIQRFLNNRSASRYTTKISATPNTRALIRQPKESLPKTLIPAAISHLPIGGWT